MPKPIEAVKPRGNQVFIKLALKPAKSAGGIILPDNVRENQQDRMGVILALGPACNGPDACKPALHVGQTVLINFVEGTKVDDRPNDLPEGQYRLVPEEKVLAIVE